MCSVEHWTTLLTFSTWAFLGEKEKDDLGRGWELCVRLLESERAARSGPAVHTGGARWG